MLTYLKYLYDLFLPSVCYVCGKSLFNNDVCVCFNCLHKMPKTDFFSTDSNDSEKLFWGKVKIEKAASLYYYFKGGVTRQVISQLKYGGRQIIGFEFGRLLGSEILKTDWVTDLDVIIPVPLHPGKEFKRGYNQSLKIAEGVSKVLKIEIDNKSMIRNVFTDTQTKKSTFDRWENVSDVFTLKNSEKFENKKILILDDVLTTGSTLEACTSQFSEVKNCKIYIATLAISKQI